MGDAFSSGRNIEGQNQAMYLLNNNQSEERVLAAGNYATVNMNGTGVRKVKMKTPANNLTQQTSMRGQS